MKPYLHPKDSGLKFQRRIGKRRWKEAAIAKAAPQELDGAAERVIHELIETEIQESGMPYLSIHESLYGWLKTMAGMDHWQAKALLAILKDFPDLMPFRKVEGEPFTRCLPLEVKTRKGRARPGQKRLAETVGGVIANGYQEALAAWTAFREAP